MAAQRPTTDNVEIRRSQSHTRARVQQSAKHIARHTTPTPKKPHVHKLAASRVPHRSRSAPHWAADARAMLTQFRYLCASVCVTFCEVVRLVSLSYSRSVHAPLQLLLLLPSFLSAFPRTHSQHGSTCVYSTKYKTCINMRSHTLARGRAYTHTVQEHKNTRSTTHTDAIICVVFPRVWPLPHRRTAADTK